LMSESAKVPIEVVRDYLLPAYVDSATLVIAVSYSGNTEEVLTAAQQGKGSGAKVIAVTKGGKLAEWAAKSNIPTLIFEYDSSPRAALGFLFAPLVIILEKLGLASYPANLENLAFEDFTEPAKSLAKKLNGKMPIIAGSGFLIPVARRFKNQINENSKQTAVAEEIPELFHNVVQGLDFPKNLAESVIFIVLNSNFYHPRNSLRIMILKDILDEKKLPYEILEIAGPDKLSQMLNAIMMADMVSFYLAMLNDVDPTVIPTIDYLKQQLEMGK